MSNRKEPENPVSVLYLRIPPKATKMKEDLDQNSLEVECVFSEVEEKHADMIDTYYSFQNGLTLLKQLAYPSLKYPIAPDCEIPNSVIRGIWKEEKYEKGEEVYDPEYYIGFISSKELLISKETKEKDEAKETESVSTTETTESKKTFQKRGKKGKQTSKHKRISTLSKTLPDESKNSPFIQLCGQLFSELWFPKDCELEVIAIIDQLIEMLDTPDSATHNKVCNYIIEFYRMKKIPQSKVSFIGQKAISQLTHETDTQIIINCIQLIAGLHLKTDMNVSLIKSFLNSENPEFRKAAKEALRTLGIKQESSQIKMKELQLAKEEVLEDTPSKTKVQTSKEISSSSKKQSSKDMASDMKKHPSKESKSRTKMQPTKEPTSKSKKHSLKEGKPEKEKVISEEPDSKTEGQAEIEPDTKTEEQGEIDDEAEDQIAKEPFSILEEQAEIDDEAEDQIAKMLPPKEPDSYTKDQDEIEPFSKTKDEAEVEKAGKDVISSSIEQTEDLQGEKDSRLKGVEEEIAKKDFVEEQKISQLPTEEILEEKEFLFDADEIVQSEDDKERLKELELAESLAEEDESDLDTESILSEQLKSKYVSEDHLAELKLKEAKLRADKNKARRGVKASKKLKATQFLQRTPKESNKNLLEVSAREKEEDVEEEEESEEEEEEEKRERKKKPYSHKTDISEISKTTKTQTLDKQKKRFELENLQREKVAKIVEMKKNPFLLKDSLKSSVGRKPVKRPSHYFIGRDMATTRQQIPTVDKVRASLLPLSKSTRKFGNLAKQLNIIDKLPKRTTMTLKHTKSLLDEDTTIPSSQFQAQLQAKMEHKQAVSLPVEATAATAFPPADTLLQDVADSIPTPAAFHPAAATLPPVVSANAMPPVTAAATYIPPSTTADTTTTHPRAAVDTTQLPRVSADTTPLSKGASATTSLPRTAAATVATTSHPRAADTTTSHPRAAVAATAPVQKAGAAAATTPLPRTGPAATTPLPRTGPSATTPLPRTGPAATTPLPRTGPSATTPLPRTGPAATTPLPRTGPSATTPLPRTGPAATTFLPRAGPAATTPLPRAGPSATTPLPRTGPSATTPLPRTGPAATTFLPRAGPAATTPLPRAGPAATTPLPRAGVAAATPLPRAGVAATTPLPRAGAAATTPLPRAGVAATTPLPRAGAAATTPLPRAGPAATTSLPKVPSAATTSLPRSAASTAAFIPKADATDITLLPRTAAAATSFLPKDDAAASILLQRTATTLPPASAALLTGTVPTGIPPTDTAFLTGVPAAAISPAAAALLTGAAATAFFPGTAAPDNVSFTKYQDIYSGSNQQVVTQEEYPGKKHEVPFENQTSSWVNAALYGDIKNQVPAEDRLQKFSKSRLSKKRSYKKDEIADGEYKTNSSKEWAQKFPWSSIQKAFVDAYDNRVAAMEGQEQEQRWSDVDWSRSRNQKIKDIKDKDKDIRLSKRLKQKSVWSDVNKTFMDPTKNYFADMIGSQQEHQWSESDDWSKKRAYKVKPIKERDEETNLIKTWVHDLPWSNVQKTFSSTIDYKLAEAKQQKYSGNAEMFQKSDFRGEMSSRERDFKKRSTSNLPWKGFLPIYVDTGYSILTDIKNTEMDQRWSESAGPRAYQKSLANITSSDLLWSNKAFYSIDELSPWMRYHLQYRPERVEKEYIPSLEVKNISQSPPEWFPKYRRMMFSPDFYQQREKWLNDYRRPTSIIY